MTNLIGLDYETHLFGPENLAPRAVCLSASTGTVEDSELATREAGDLEILMRELLDSDQIKVGANLAFDFAVACKETPDLYPLIFREISEGRASDIQVREKLLNLADTGDLEYAFNPDGSKRKLKYGLDTLAELYLGITMVGKAKPGEVGEDEAWRLNYDVLEDVPLVEWPEEAVLYSILDSVYPVQIWHAQEARRAELELRLGIDPLQVESFRCLLRFCFYLMTIKGVATDAEEHAKIVEELAEALTPEKLCLLVEHEILRPAIPPKPWANGAKEHDFDCPRPTKKEDPCDCPVKLTKPKKASINKEALYRVAMDLKKDHPDVVLRYTDKGSLQVDKEFLDDYARRCPILTQYQGRQAVQKLVTTDMPRMEWPKGSGKVAPVLHANYDFLKETGRSSSFASKAYPSWNCQNPHPRVRACIVPRETYVLYSVDYSGMELGTLAQKCYDLFGFSVLRDVINRGWDAHSYLGAHLAFFLDDNFHDSVIEENPDPQGEDLYEAFMACKRSGVEEVRKFYKHYRTFAKPTGLGYPGGLGPKTFVQYAHATYKIEVDEELAGELREVWHRCFPEMAPYLKWISDSCPDPHHKGSYAYITPLGMYRAGAAYCAAANGAGLQAPSAEGAMLAVCDVVEATFANVGSTLYADDQGDRHRSLLFIHDELIGEARIDCAHEVAHEVARIMVECMSIITPDVTPRADPVLMLRWDKRAEPVYIEGRLVPWKADK